MEKRALRHVSHHVLGINTGVARRAARGLKQYRADRAAFVAQMGDRSDFVMGTDFPCPGDRYAHGGAAGGDYFHQDLLCAQLIHEAKPERHLDVGSRIDGFVTHVATFMPIEVIDIRPIPPTSAKNITFAQGDLMAEHSEWNESTSSLSCLHVLEHFGLGRYGDDIDVDGHLKGWQGLWRMLRPGGTLYFSVPMGEVNRIEFNGHRVMSLPYLMGMVNERNYDVRSFSYVDDAGELHRDAPTSGPDADRSFGAVYGCAIFELLKR